jgi:hypothetical protein
MLDDQASAVLRDQLSTELKDVGSLEEAATWAHRILAAKNSLSVADARQVEDSFQSVLTTLQGAANFSDAVNPHSTLERREADNIGTSVADGINKSHLAGPEPRRLRDKDHVTFVAKQQCLICGRTPADRFAQHRALGRRVSDDFTVPLCRGHHRELHGHGDEAAWWKKAGIDPIVPARALWLETHPLPTASGDAGNETATSAAAVVTDPSRAERNGQVSTRRQNYSRVEG